MGQRCSMYFRRLVLIILLLLAVMMLTSCQLLLRWFPPRAIPMVFSGEQPESVESRVNLLGTVAPASTVSLAFAVKAQQTGAFAAGFSGSPDEVMPFHVSKIDSLGNLVGDAAVRGDLEGESFVLPHPSVVSDLPDGTIVTGAYGSLVVRFGTNVEEQINLQKNPFKEVNATTLDRVDEFVVRLGGELEEGVDARLIFGLHAIVEDEFGETATCEVTVNGSPAGFSYILMVPASKVGVGFSYRMGLIGQSTFRNPTTSSGDLADDWFTDDVGNAGLFEMIDAIVGTTPASRRDSADWMDLADYFRSFVRRYGRGNVWPMNDGDGEEIDLEMLVIAFDDSQGPLAVESDEGVWIQHIRGDTVATVTDGTLDLTGTDPLHFEAVITDAYLYEPPTD